MNIHYRCNSCHQTVIDSRPYELCPLCRRGYTVSSDNIDVSPEQVEQARQNRLKDEKKNSCRDRIMANGGDGRTDNACYSTRLTRGFDMANYYDTDDREADREWYLPKPKKPKRRKGDCV